MFTGVLLVCLGASCHAAGGPLVLTESECHESLSQGVAEITGRNPDVIIVSGICVPWGQGA